eukprot:349679-Chlamydomonas_euryale.AAC.3
MMNGYWTDAHYYQQLHMSRANFHMLCDVLRPHIEGIGSNFKEALPVEKKVAVTLFRLTNESFTYKIFEGWWGLAASTPCKVVHQVVCAVIDVMRSTYLKCPSGEQAVRIKEAFAAKGFPNCLGCIDGTHIKIHKPTIMYSEDFYCVRKASNTIQVQAVCDDRGYIWDAVLGRPGSCHDSVVLKNSNLYQNAESVIMQNGPGIQLECPAFTVQGFKPYILGDGGYANLPWLILPIPSAQLTHPSMIKWNTFHSSCIDIDIPFIMYRYRSCRKVIERCFGRLKMRFRGLLGTIRQRKSQVMILTMGLRCGCGRQRPG